MDEQQRGAPEDLGGVRQAREVGQGVALATFACMARSDYEQARCVHAGERPDVGQLMSAGRMQAKINHETQSMRFGDKTFAEREAELAAART